VEWFLEPFALGFQQRALIGGALAGLMSAVVGTWLVLRGMSFFGDAFVHGVVPGIAAALVLDINPVIGAAVAAAVMVLAIEVVHRKTTLSEDTSIGLLFVGMLALGVVIISRLDNYSGSLTSILFGDALGFNREKAQMWGLRPQRAHAALLVLIAASVIGSYQSVGTLLVFGLLVGPPATAALIARTVPRMMFLAAGISLVSVWLGLTLSYHLRTAGSATMAIMPIIFFFIVLTITRLRPRRPVAVESHA
jgi:manganese/iron transport system permease protein